MALGPYKSKFAEAEESGLMAKYEKLSKEMDEFLKEVESKLPEEQGRGGPKDSFREAAASIGQGLDDLKYLLKEIE